MRFYYLYDISLRVIFLSNCIFSCLFYFIPELLNTAPVLCWPNKDISKLFCNYYCDHAAMIGY